MTLVRDVLPPEVASKLLQQLELESVAWNRGNWILFGKEHIIPRTTATYNLMGKEPVSNPPSFTYEAAGDELNTDDPGKNHFPNNNVEDDQQQEDEEYADQPRPLSPELRQAALRVAQVVEEHCPWAVTRQNQGWEPTFAFANRYANGRDCVGWHSDHITPLGPRPIIVGLTLGACRRFELRQQQQQRQPNAVEPDSMNQGRKSLNSNANCRHVSVPLPHNSLCIMWNDAQESWQHSVPRCSDDAIVKHPKVGLVRISPHLSQETAHSRSRDLLLWPSCGSQGQRW